MRPDGAPLSFRAASLSDSGLIRRAENPLAFVPPRSAAWHMSVGYLQVVYAQLLLFPYNLCVEYSFDCIPMVYSVDDPRNLGTALLLVAGTAYAVGLLRRAAGRHSPTAPDHASSQ